MKKYLWTTITVNNLEESIKFYNEILGLKVNRRFAAGPGKEIAFLGEGDTKIELVCDSNIKIENRSSGISLGFKVENLDETLKMTEEKGIKMTKGIFQPNPHVKFFFVNDPNGIDIQFVEEI
ncbi:VOC family protein [Anaerovorax odorimutans]|uniref:VOC family protein n=1 Tax=Anaerovorax odorimutans TaxID=109327 RepID=UPI00040484D0|nr:VOC family protein [Anaerovorax odorimutans]